MGESIDLSGEAKNDMNNSAGHLTPTNVVGLFRRNVRINFRGQRPGGLGDGEHPAPFRQATVRGVGDAGDRVAHNRLRAEAAEPVREELPAGLGMRRRARRSACSRSGISLGGAPYYDFGDDARRVAGRRARCWRGERRRHGATGFLFSRGDAGPLTRLLDRLCGNPQLRAGLGEAGPARYVEAFTLKRCWARRGRCFTMLSASQPGFKRPHPQVQLVMASRLGYVAQ